MRESILKPIFLGLVMTLINACGLSQPFDHQQKSGGRQFSTSDPALSPYVESFEKKAQDVLSKSDYSVGDIPVNFGDTENEEYVGVCFEYSDGKKEVIVRRSWWKRVGEKERESLIFHELGHCALDRDHNNETITIDEEKVKLSIMNSKLVMGDHYKDYRSDYHVELFTLETAGIIQTLNGESEETDSSDEETESTSIASR